MRLSHADGRLFSRERALRWHGYQSDREATGRWRPGKLVGGTCVVGAKPSASRYFVARVLELSSLRQAVCTHLNMGPATKTPANTSSFSSTAASATPPATTTTTTQRHDTTRYDTTRSRSRNRTASRDRHVPTPSSSPAISSQQWYLASHYLVCGMTKVSFVVRTQAARRVLSQIRRPRRPLYGPSYQGLATSVKVVALDLSLALALPNRAVQNEAEGLDLVPSI